MTRKKKRKVDNSKSVSNPIECRLSQDVRTPPLHVKDLYSLPSRSYTSSSFRSFGRSPSIGRGISATVHTLMSARRRRPAAGTQNFSFPPGGGSRNHAVRARDAAPPPLGGRGRDRELTSDDLARQITTPSEKERTALPPFTKKQKEPPDRQIDG